MQLTLEERERRAYIANSPDHPLLVEALEGDAEKLEEINELKAEADRLDSLLSTSNDDLEVAENRIEKLEGELAEATETIESAGLDLA
jgi:chromosome segregation ATPase